MWIQSQIDFIALLKNTGPVAKAVLLTLLVFSIWSWGIILSKVLLLRKVARESEIFWKIFNKGQTLSEISTACETLRFTPLVGVLNSAVDLLQPGHGKSQNLMSAPAEDWNSGSSFSCHASTCHATGSGQRIDST
jgi:biopolymer transport protein ExbB/TolQ